MTLQPQKALELKKHVATIHSSNQLTLLQRKIANALLFNAYKNLKEKEEHTIHIAQLCQLIGYNSNDHKRIKQSLVNLISTVIEWNLIDGERLNTAGIWNASSIIAGASIEGAVCTYSYSTQMRKLLYHPEMYGRLDMLVQAKFQSGYGLALYENCNRFQEIGQTPWVDLMKFRKLMGVGDGKYKIFRDFKTRVLDKAVEEVNQYSSLVVSPQLRKQNRQVVSIQFLIKKSHTMTTHEQHTVTTDQASLLHTLKIQFGCSVKQINEIIAQYEEGYIRKKVDLILSSSSFQSGKVKNLARYLLSALRDDYQPVKQHASCSNRHIKREEQTEQGARQDVVKLTAFKRFQEKQLVALFHALPKQNQLSVLKQFEKFLTGMYHHIYLRDGVQNLLVQEQLYIFLHHINHALVAQLITYDAWLTQ